MKCSFCPNEREIVDMTITRSCKVVCSECLDKVADVLTELEKKDDGTMRRQIESAGPD